MDVQWFMYSKFTNNLVSDVKLTSELGPSMNSVLLLRSKIKGQRKTIKFGSDTSLVLYHTQLQSRFVNCSRDTVPLNKGLGGGGCVENK